MRKTVAVAALLILGLAAGCESTTSNLNNDYFPQRKPLQHQQDDGRQMWVFRGGVRGSSRKKISRFTQEARSIDTHLKKAA